ncbi:MAG TPA: hypothetical protein VFM93_08880 [Candidatus Limnocylindria bacterium]|nr:hypothetical protein [Candidatus Limnocylindria bacterium]
MDDRFERAWAAGFFDGEGWAGRARRGVQARVNQADPNGVPEALERFRRAVGHGRIHGPELKPGRIDIYRWEATSRSDVEAVAAAIGPWLGPVKRAQVAGALGRDLVAPEDDLADPSWRAWAAGLWDGEGSVSLAAHRSHLGHHVLEAAVTQEGSEHGCAILARLLSILQQGHVYGPYVQDSANAPVYRWKAYGVDAARRSIHVVLPWLGRAKRYQAVAALSVVDREAALPRGNPAWGNRKTHCVNGHAYATARLRPFRPRQGGAMRRPSKQCLVCVRESARRRRRNKDDGPAGPSS